MNKKSESVPLGVVGLLAVAFAACSDATAYCVDQDDVVVENENCEDDDRARSGGFFVYYGAIGSGIRRGSRLSGGERIVASNKSAIAQRGGFGGSARSGGVGRSVSGGSGGGFGGGG